MGLIKCPECQTEISDQALACPKCGAPQVAAKKAARKKKSDVQGAGCLLILLGFVLAAGAGYMWGWVAVIGLVILVIGFFI